MRKHPSSSTNGTALLTSKAHGMAFTTVTSDSTRAKSSKRQPEDDAALPVTGVALDRQEHAREVTDQDDGDREAGGHATAPARHAPRGTEMSGKLTAAPRTTETQSIAVAERHAIGRWQRGLDGKRHTSAALAARFGYSDTAMHGGGRIAGRGAIHIDTAGQGLVAASSHTGEA